MSTTMFPSHNEENNTLSQKLQRFKQAMYQAMFTVVWFNPISANLLYLYLFIDALQLLGFAFASHGTSPFTWSDLQFLQSILQYFGPSAILKSYQESASYLVLIIAVIVFVAHVTIFLSLSAYYYLYDDMAEEEKNRLAAKAGVSGESSDSSSMALLQQQRRSSDNRNSFADFRQLVLSDYICKHNMPSLVLHTIQAFRMSLNLITYVGFIPMMTAMFGFGMSVMQDPFNQWSAAAGNSGGSLNTLGAAVGIVMGLLFALYIGFWVSVNYDFLPDRNSASTRAHPRADLVHHAARVVLVLVFCATSVKALWSLALILSTGASLFVFWFWMPYYVPEVLILRVSSLSMVVWASLSGLVDVIATDGSMAGGSLLFYVGVPICIALGVLSMIARQNSFATKEMDDMRHPYEAELIVRYTDQDGKKMSIKNNVTGDVESGSNEKNALLAQDQASAKQQKAEMANRIFTDATHRFAQSNMLHYIWAVYHLQRSEFPQSALTHLTQCQDFNASWDQQLFIQRIRHMVTLWLQNYAADFIVFVTYEQRIAEAKRYNILAAQQKAEFWNSVLEHNPDLQKMHKHSSEHHNHISKARLYYESALSLNSNFPQELRGYASFALDMLNDGEQAKLFLNRAEQIDNQRNLQQQRQDKHRHHLVAYSTQNDSNNAANAANASVDVFDENQAILLVDGNGVIKQANMSASRMFEYLQNEIELRHMSDLLPHPWSDHFQAHLTQLLQHGSSPLSGYYRECFGVNKHGVIFHCAISMQQISIDLSSPCCMLVIRNLSINGEEWMLANDHDLITHHSAGAHKLFPHVWSPMTRHNSTIPLSSCIPAAADAGREQLYTEQGLVMPLCEQATGMVAAGSHLVLQVCATPLGPLNLTNSHQEVDTGVQIMCLRLLPDKSQSQEVVSNRAQQLTDETEPDSTTGNGGNDVEPEDGRASDDEDDEEESRNNNNKNLKLPSLQLKIKSKNSNKKNSQEHDILGLDSPRGRASPRHQRKRSDSEQPSIDEEKEASAIELQEVALHRGNEEDAQEIVITSSVNKKSNHLAPDQRSEISFRTRSTQQTHNTVAMVANLRRMFLSSNSKDESLVRLKFVFLATVLVLIGVGVGNYMAGHLYLKGYTGRLSDTVKNHRVMTFTYRIGYEARTLNLINQGLLPAGDEAPSRTRLLFYINSLENEHNQLFYVSSGLTAAHEALMRRPSIPILEKSGTRVAERLYSLDEMIRAVVSHGRLVWEQTVPELSANNDHVFFLLQNQATRFITPLNTTVKFNTEEGVSDLDLNSRFQVVFMAAAVSSVFIIMILVFRPAIARVERTKEEVLQLFLHLSKSTVRSLLLQTEQHLQGLTSEDVQADEDNGRLQKENPQGGGGTSSTDDKDNKPSRAIKFGKSNNEEKDEHGHKNSSSGCCSSCRGLSASQYVIAIKTALIFLVSAAFFVSMYLWGRNVVSQVSPLAKDVEYNERNYRAVNVGMHVREMYSLSPQNQTDIDSWRQQGYDLIQWIQFISTGLTYGSDFIGTSGTAGRVAAQDQLMFGNMCASTYTTYTAGCETYWNKLNTHGLQSSYLEYLNIASNLYDQYNASAAMNLTTTNLRFIHTMHTTYLNEALNAIPVMYLLEADNITNSFFAGTLLLLIVYSLILVLMFVFMYRPLIEELSKDSSRTRGTLFIVPFDVLQSVPHIRQFLKERAAMLAK